MNYKTYDQWCKDGISLANKELSMWNDLHGITKSSIDIKRIPIQAKDVNDHEHTEIDPKKTYLINYDGRWILTKFRRTYHNHGWEFDLGSHSMTLSSVAMIYEIEDLPVIPKQLIERTVYEEDEDDECI